MKQELTTAQDNQTLTISDRMQASGVSPKDFQPARLALLQPASDMVNEGGGVTGDIVNTASQEILGGNGKPIEFIPIELYKTLVVEDATSQPPKFLRQEPLTSNNEKLPWEDRETNDAGISIPIKRTHCFNFFVLLTKDINNDEALPTVIRFKSASMATGKKLASHMLSRNMLRQPAYSQAICLDSAKQKKEINGKTTTYATFTLPNQKRLISDKEREAVELWAPSLAALRTTVLNSSDQEPMAKTVKSEVLPHELDEEPRF